MAKDVKGSVLVVGGGIAGMQSAVDLANSGYYVYLLEKSPSIGGVMSQLDKTFPTNDCSICIEAPKMSDVDLHPNIEILALAELESERGTRGNLLLDSQAQLSGKPSLLFPEGSRGSDDPHAGH